MPLDDRRDFVHRTVFLLLAPALAHTNQQLFQSTREKRDIHLIRDSLIRFHLIGILFKPSRKALFSVGKPRRRFLCGLVFHQNADKRVARVLLFLFFGKQHSAFDVHQLRGHRDEFAGDLHVHLLHQINVFHILIENQRYLDIQNIHLVFGNQSEQKLERAFKYFGFKNKLFQKNLRRRSYTAKYLIESEKRKKLDEPVHAAD